MKSLHINWT